MMVSISVQPAEAPLRATDRPASSRRGWHSTTSPPAAFVSDATPSSCRLPLLLAVLLALLASFSSSSCRLVHALTTCSGGQCIDSDKVRLSTFHDVYSDYDPPSVGYDLPQALFHFFIAIVSILVFVWLVFFSIQARSVYVLAHGLLRGRVLRVPAIYASMRHSITRDVIAAWMQRHEAPVPPATVNQIPIQVHFPMANAKLCVHTHANLPPSAAPTSGLTSPSGAVSSPSSSSSSEYTLKFTLSTIPGHACLVEVWFGVPMKTVALFLSDYAKFRARHGSAASGPTVNASTKLKSPTKPVASPAKRGSSTAVADHAPSSPVANGRMVQPRDPEAQAFVSTGNANRLTPAARPGPRTPKYEDDSPPLSPHRGGMASRSSRVAPGLSIQTNAALPGSAPSPNNSPSHATAESERSKHLSQLSLRERERGSMSTRPTSPYIAGAGGASSAGGNVYATNLLTAALGTGNVLGLTPSGYSGPSAGLAPSGSPGGSPAPGSTSSAASSVQPLFTLSPGEGTNLFWDKEAMFTLAPTMFPSGSKQPIHLHFPQAYLRAVLADQTKCPILVFLSGVDEAAPMQLGKQNQSTPQSQLAGELTIIQFTPPPAAKGDKATNREATNGAGSGEAGAAGSLLPASAISQQVPEPDETGDRVAGSAAGPDESPDPEIELVSPAAAAVVSPTGGGGLQDAITCRVKFDRQLVLSQAEAYEMEELYGLEESEAECVACLTDIREVILLPCKHVCVCSGCFKSLTKCPICRARIHSHMTFTDPSSIDKLTKPGSVVPDPD